MLRFYNKPIGSCHNGIIKFKAEEIVKLKTLSYSIEYSKALGSHIAKFGELVYMLDIKDGIVEKSGILSVSTNGDEFYVVIGKEVSMKILTIDENKVGS